MRLTWPRVVGTASSRRGRRGALAAALAAALALAAGPARADDHDTWAEIIDPHGEEIRQILDKTAQADAQAQNFANYDGDPTGEARTKLLDDAYGMLRYAHRLAPHNSQVLFALGKVADDGGRTRAAIDALEAYLAAEESPLAEAHQRLGRLYLRLHQPDRAIRHLRLAVAGGSQGVAVVYLAEALSAAGRDDEATEVLADAVQAAGGNYYDVNATLVGLALAVAYDRDEQLSAAFQTIDRMQNGMSGSYPSTVQQALGAIQLEPVEQRYWQALFYETAGFYAEARAEWLNYAAGGAAARWRDRALAHVAAIDKLRADELAARKAAKGKKPPEPPPPPGGVYPMP